MKYIIRNAQRLLYISNKKGIAGYSPVVHKINK